MEAQEVWVVSWYPFPWCRDQKIEYVRHSPCAVLSTRSCADELSVICWQQLFQNVCISDDGPLPGRPSCCPLIPNECLLLCHATPVESKCAPWVLRNNVGVPVTTTCVVVSVAMSVTSLSRLSVRKSFHRSSPGWHVDDPFWQDPNDPAN